ncbi:hypothetical protein ER45_030515 (plasmid) [Bacillus mycoides]|nr:hypothetical protein ER45_030515 [Bacillus mycoides]
MSVNMREHEDLRPLRYGDRVEITWYDFFRRTYVVTQDGVRGTHLKREGFEGHAFLGYDDTGALLSALLLSTEGDWPLLEEFKIL